MPETVKIIVHSVPADLKAAIADEVNDGEYRSMNDAIRYQLSEFFSVPYTSPPVGDTKPAVISDSPKVSLKIDRRLDRKIENAAHRDRTSKRNVIVEVLCDAFGVPFVATGRWVESA